MKDVTEAIALAEGAACQRILLAAEVELPSTNAFGERVSVERGRDAAALVRRCGELASAGERVALVAHASELALARGELARVASHRLGVVVHALTGPADGLAPALALGDLPWGLLVASGAAESSDLALVAHRAAEDSGCPFFVVHDAAARAEAAAASHRELCEAFLGGPRPAPAPADDHGPTLAERVPFALASAMRDLESLVPRRRDVIERRPGPDAPVALVGVGALGDSVLAEIDRLRAAGRDVAAVRLIAWRPFPGPRLVKALCRALAVTVLEGADWPLASNGPLAVQLKAAFADALTWAPEYPGIGRIPRIASGIVAHGRGVHASDVDAMVENMLAHERGKLVFAL